MNIQEIIKKATIRMKEPTISNVASTTNEEAMTYLESANKVAKSIAEVYNWSNLVLDYSFDTVDGTQEYELPSDFQRLNSTYLYNLSQNYAIASEDADRALSVEASNTINWTTVRYRLVRDNIRFTTAANQVNTIKFSYITNEVVKNTEDGTIYKEQFTTNEDTFLLDDELLVIGIIIDLKQQYGFDISLELSEFKTRLDTLTGNDKGGYVLTDNDGYNSPSFLFPANFTPVDWSV